MNKNTLPTPEVCWQAIMTRDKAFDGVFYYGVHSTGIYCRPSCASRQPAQDGVAYFASPGEAQQAGYRACKRCQPNQSSAPAEALVERICSILDNADEQLSLRALGQQLGLSASYLQRVFKANTGLSPRQYAAARRMARFKNQAQAMGNVASAQYAAGYGSARGLYEQAARHLGMTPSTYRRGGHGMLINYTIAPCALGWMLVAATDRGLCSVQLGDEPQQLEAALRREFPAASLEKDNNKVAPWLEAIAAYLEGAPMTSGLPMDVTGSAFQIRVWEALRQIPYGQTNTYAQVAVAIGQPTAARAVAHACASNPTALVTPCHRVVRSDGGLGGYRWGLERKQSLLAREKQHVKETVHG